MNWDTATSQTDFFKGRMDSVRIYDWNITANEVQELYVKESAKLHLKLDDTFNDSIGTVTGNQSGGVTFKQGMENRSAYFDGSNDYVSFGTGTTKPNGLSGYSISLWVKSNAKATASNNNAYIVKQTDTNGDIFRFGYWSNKLILKIRNSSVNISTETEPTSWTHYVITATENLMTSSTTATVYKNGSQIWNGTISAKMGSFSANYKPWVLGGRLGSSADFFKGEMDNVRFYSSVLTEADVKALYRSEFSGIRYCDTDQNSAGCSVVNNTIYDLSKNSWLIPAGMFSNGLPILRPISQTSIESIKVSEGWEAYLCTQANNNGDCYYYDDGFYKSSNWLDSSLINKVYSITVQPASFSAAKKFFGYRRADDSGNYPAGFAYIYEVSDFYKPTKLNNFRRLFLNSYDRYNFSGNLRDSIIGTNRAASVELYGDVYLEIDNGIDTQYLMTSHNDFRKNIKYPDLNFRQFYNNVDYAYLHGKNEKIGSVGWFLASGSPSVDRIKSQCLKGVSKTINHNPTRIECVKYGESNLPFDDYGINRDPYGFLSRVYNGDKQKFERYADNYSLLMLDGHGNYFSDIYIWIPYYEEDKDKYDDNLNIKIKDDGSDPYSQNLGKQYTRWLEITACLSMGDKKTNWSEVGKKYYNILTRLNGVGGYRKESHWGGWNDTHNYDAHWKDLTYNNKTVSKAWVDSWSESFIGDADRDARFLTLEKCDCTQSSCTGTYMKNDYFYNVSSGPKPQKKSSEIANYKYYCVRDRDSQKFENYTKNLSKQSQNYPKKFSAYSYDSAPDEVIEQLFDIRKDEKNTKFLEENIYDYKDDYLILNRNGKNIRAVMNRKMASFEDEDESENMILDKINEAKDAAEALTSIKLEYSGISRDVNEAFEVGGNGESLGKTINSVAFVFRPVINGIPIFSESIEVEYDAEGFYQLRSNVPYSLSATRTGLIKSEKEIKAKIYSATGKNEEKVIAYVLNEKNEFVLSAVAKDETTGTFIEISMEANNE